jgi:hypothetical protein
MTGRAGVGGVLGWLLAKNTPRPFPSPLAGEGAPAGADEGAPCAFKCVRLIVRQSARAVRPLIRQFALPPSPARGEGTRARPRRLLAARYRAFEGVSKGMRGARLRHARRPHADVEVDVEMSKQRQEPLPRPAHGCFLRRWLLSDPNPRDHAAWVTCMATTDTSVTSRQQRRKTAKTATSPGRTMPRDSPLGRMKQAQHKRRPGERG